MINVTDITNENKHLFIKMCSDFYNSNAVLHSIPIKHIEDSAAESINNSPYIRCLLLELDGVICGYSVLSFTYSNEAGGMVVLLEEIQIKSEFRGQGIGNQFFDWLFKAYDSKTKRYRLEVSKDNERVCNLYRKRGFTDFDYLQMVIEMKVDNH